MAIVTEGDTVKVHYTLRLADGSVFDTSIGSDPLQFTIGSGSVITGFNQAVVGMKPGESKTVEIPAEEAYGLYRDDLIFELDINELPEGFDQEVGQQLTLRQPDGQVWACVVVTVSETTITVDANHSLAGKDLTFDIELVGIL